MMKKSRNPFRDIGVEHNSGDDALCLSRAHDLDPVLESFRESAGVAAVAALEGFARWAFFAARHSAELLLKALLPGYEQDKHLKGCHDLKMLLGELAARGDDLLGTGDDQQLIVEFIRELDRHDPSGDQGRYPKTLRGELSLEKVCCADRDEFVPGSCPTGALRRASVDRLPACDHGESVASETARAATDRVAVRPR